MFEFDVKQNGTEVDVKLKGHLDATVAPSLHGEIAKLQGQGITNVLFDASELDYIASAGLRVIIFSKQKLGTDTTVQMKGVNDEVKKVLEMTGCQNFIELI